MNTDHLPKTYRYLGAEVTALRIVIGKTTKSDILFVCPTANVGAHENDETDLRWVVVDHLGYHAEVRQGEWIVRYNTETEAVYWVVNHQVFSLLATEETEDRRTRMERLARVMADALVEHNPDRFLPWDESPSEDREASLVEVEAILDALGKPKEK